MLKIGGARRERVQRSRANLQCMLPGARRVIHAWEARARGASSVPPTGHTYPGVASSLQVVCKAVKDSLDKQVYIVLLHVLLHFTPGLPPR